MGHAVSMTAADVERWGIRTMEGDADDGGLGRRAWGGGAPTPGQQVHALFLFPTAHAD